MAISAHDPRSWGTAGTWSGERWDEALARTPPFGQRFLTELFGRRPDLRARARFLRWSEQPEDVYMMLDRPGGGAGVQLDAALEYVIVWGGDGVPTEYGDWGADPVPPAVAHLLSLVPPGAPEAEPGTHPTSAAGRRSAAATLRTAAGGRRVVRPPRVAMPQALLPLLMMAGMVAGVVLYGLPFRLFYRQANWLPEDEFRAAFPGKWWVTRAVFGLAPLGLFLFGALMMSTDRGKTELTFGFFFPLFFSCMSAVLAVPELAAKASVMVPVGHNSRTPLLYTVSRNAPRAAVFRVAAAGLIVAAFLWCR